MSLLVVMGSGETAPTMVKVHREVLARSGRGPAVMLDTPFGFQMNADDLVLRTQRYFAESVGVDVEVARWRRADAPTVEREKALALLTRAAWAFAGPGSPTYALRQWQGTPLPQALLDVAHRGGTLVFGSAAACTLGTHTIPVYEIYKVGAEPAWATGLNLLGRLTGIDAVVIPHYDNAEGGQHDTRYCYLGEQRLTALERDLPDHVGVLGVDEHTALVIDVDAGRAHVTGNGTVTVRYRTRSRQLPPGQEISLPDLARLLTGEDAVQQPAADAAEPGGEPDRPPGGRPATPGGHPGTHPATDPTGLPELTAMLRARFDAALDAGDIDGCVSAVLDLEAGIAAWSADTLQSDATDRARRVLRSLVVRLGDLARSGMRDPRAAVQPFIEALLDLRGRARTGKDYATADVIRDRLITAGVEVRDTPDGAQWSLPISGGDSTR